MTANEDYFDAAIRHQIGVRQYTAGSSKRVADLLEAADRRLVEKLRSRLARMGGGPIDFTGARWQALLVDVREARKAVMKEYKKTSRKELRQFGVNEAIREEAILTAAIPVELAFATVSTPTLRAIVTDEPFQGRFLRDWFQTLERNDQRRLVSTLQLGMADGSTTDEIVREIVGTRRNNYTDGILATTRREAQTIVRTAINHVSNKARSTVWAANSDIIAAKVWSSTLDGRTSAICRDRDGKGTPAPGKKLPTGILPLHPPGAMPPAHMNCRSIMVAYIDGVGLVGKRPFVTDTRTAKAREIDFRAEARRTNTPIKEVRAAWAKKHIGQLPSKVTYNEFLGRQSPSFQDRVLGRTKGRLYRKGGLDVHHFVDRRGNELTLDQLADTRPEAFTKAGLNPADF